MVEGSAPRSCAQPPPQADGDGPAAVDDYGTGYCALAYLRDLPIDELKIDRSFVAHVTTDPRSAAIVRSTLELGHALDLKVVAEGVEDQAALDVLAGIGCDYAQGYHFGRPVPAGAFDASTRVGRSRSRRRSPPARNPLAQPRRRPPGPFARFPELLAELR